jgi:hypothetical protein
MATLNLWSFSKKKNSTKQPTGAATTKTVRLKEGTSLESPVFVLDGAVHGYNYAQFGGVYYFVDDVVIAKNAITELHCSRDLLATFKSEIQASTLYVLYYTHNNTEITDKRLSTKTTQVTDSANGAFTYFGVGITTALTVVGMDHVATFKVNLSDVKDIISQTFFQTLDTEIGNVPAIDTSSVENAISDAGRFIVDLLKTAAISASYVGKLAECIRDCYLLPIDPAAWGGTNNPIFIGKCDTGKTGYELVGMDLINSRVLHDSATVNIPWQASDWRRNAPYHEIYLYIPCIGVTSISPSDVIGETALHVDISVDKLSGDMIVNVGTTSKVIAQYTTNVAVNFAIGSQNLDPARAAMAIGDGLASMVGAAGGPVNIMSGAMSGALGIANAIQPHAMTIGSNGGGAFLGLSAYTANKVYCFTVFHDTTVSPSSVSAVQGTPYNGVMSLAGVSGYVQTMNAQVDMGGLGADKDAVNQMLDGGIYIE